MPTGIYEIKNLISGESYIGSSVNLDKRKKQHLYSLRKNRHPNKYLQRDFDLYGEESFIFEVLEYCELKDLIRREKYCINFFHPKYNISLIFKAYNSEKAKEDEEILKNLRNGNYFIYEKILERLKEFGRSLKSESEFRLSLIRLYPRAIEVLREIILDNKSKEKLRMETVRDIIEFEKKIEHFEGV
jgi:group I intron endonuclease